MMRKELYKTLFLFVIVSASISCQKQKPNVIFILTDQWRASALGYAGDKIVQTPYLDKFSKEAVNFNNAVSVTPVCTPYRASLMTGRYPSSTGMFINDLYLPSEELCFAEIFNEAGYNTAYLGKWHLDGHGRGSNVAPERRQGWTFWKGSECDHDYNNEHYFDNEDSVKTHWEGYSTYAIANEANMFMEDHVNDDKPFCLFVSIATPHFPHQTAPEEYKALYTPDKLQLPPNVPENQKEKALTELQGYYAHCTATDKAIGEIINKIKELGIYNNSIIVFTSDHGEMMGGHDFRPYMKHQPFSESANVPFLVSYPNMGNAAGKLAEAAITTPDILPSLLSMCNIKIPETIEGYDLSYIFKSPEKDTERAALYMNLSPFGIAFPFDEYRAVRTNRYTYVKTPQGASMLFDDKNDFSQMNNLLNRPEYADVQQKLDEQLQDELERIGEEEIHSREFYLKKFGYYGLKEFRSDYHIAKTSGVESVVSPNKVIKIK
ncbi:sulfatase [Maribellus sediminis]|uniref:sulfatase family protein n=1 Tax=Maribellus sediminis TaxID=2696285 RepID=UPI00142FA52D|nr:sulfatase [Maribellus sediminis]